MISAACSAMYAESDFDPFDLRRAGDLGLAGTGLLVRVPVCVMAVWSISAPVVAKNNTAAPAAIIVIVPARQSDEPERLPQIRYHWD